MRRGFLVAALVLAFVAACAGENKSISGYLVDKSCSAELIPKGQKALAGHDRSCALMAPCRQSGYGVATDDGQFIAFDPAGNKRALALIKASNKEKDYRVTVTGDMQGSTMKVASLKLE